MAEDTNLPDWREAAAAELAAKRVELLRGRDKAVKALERMQRRLIEVETEIADLERGAKALNLPLPEMTPPRRGPEPPSSFSVALTPHHGRADAAPQFKDVALEHLAKAYPLPRKAAEVQRHAEEVLGRSFHWKTAGMTLYRLSKEHKVRREGQNWFYVPVEDREAEGAGKLYDELKDAERANEARFDELFSLETDEERAARELQS